MMPSREFMIGQSVVQTATRYFPVTFDEGGSIAALKVALYCGEKNTMPATWHGFCENVRKEYRSILTREQLIQSGRTCQN